MIVGCLNIFYITCSIYKRDEININKSLAICSFHFSSNVQLDSEANLKECTLQLKQEKRLIFSCFREMRLYNEKLFKKKCLPSHIAFQVYKIKFFNIRTKNNLSIYSSEFNH